MTPSIRSRLQPLLAILLAALLTGCAGVLPQVARKCPHALARPSQRRFRVTTCRWSHETLQVFHKGRILDLATFAATTGTPNPALLRRLQQLLRLQFRDPSTNRRTRDACDASHQRNTPVSHRHRFSRGQESSCPLIEHWLQPLKPFPYACQVFHTTSIA